MAASEALTLRKEERICSRKLMETLFNGDTARSMSSFPLRVVFSPVERLAGQPPVSILISVPKRHFHHAVDRNRVKRQLREAYRHHKHILYDVLADHQQTALLLSFIWMEGKHLDSQHVDNHLRLLLQRIAEQLPSRLSTLNSQPSTP